MRRVQYFFCGWLLFILSFASLALSAEQEPSALGQDIEIILDASGSMAAKMGPETKITVAKKVLLDLVEGLKDRNDLALAVRIYGHQSPKQRHDCQDSKLEMPFGRPDPKKAAELLKGIKPQGYTPLAYSLVQAKNDFDFGADHRRAIILITDGLETCDGDFCQAAEELAKTGLNVVTHVIGFDLKEEDLAKLKCLTAPGGGLLLAAKDAGQLKAALGQVMSQSLAVNLIVRTKTKEGQGLVANVRIYKTGTRQTALMPLAGQVGEEVGFALPSGSYEVLVSNDQTGQKMVLADVVLDQKEKRELEVVLSKARLGVLVKGLDGRPVKGFAWVLKVEGGQETIVAQDFVGPEPRYFELIPGTYKLVLKDEDTGQKKAFDNLDLTEGQEVFKEAVFGRARLNLRIKAPAGQPGQGFVWVISQEGGQETIVAQEVLTDQPRLIHLKPGIYKLVFRYDLTDARQTIENVSLTEGQEVFKEAEFK